MMYYEEDIAEALAGQPFPMIGEEADRLGLETYVIGGYVRDLILRRPSKDIDVVTVGWDEGHTSPCSRTSARHR